MEISLKNNKIAKFSLTLSIISTIVLFLSMIFMSVLVGGSRSEDGTANVGVVVGIRPLIQLGIIAWIGIIVSLLSGIVVLFQKKVIKKYAYYSIAIDSFSVLCLVVYFVIDYIKSIP